MTDGTSSPLDAAALEHLLEITGGDQEFVDELVDTYLDDGRAQLAAMRAAADADDPVALLRPAHTLKSSSANVGALDLAELCRTLEADARSRHRAGHGRPGRPRARPHSRPCGRHSWRSARDASRRTARDQRRRSHGSGQAAVASVAVGSAAVGSTAVINSNRSTGSGIGSLAGRPSR